MFLLQPSSIAPRTDVLREFSFNAVISKKQTSIVLKNGLLSRELLLYLRYNIGSGSLRCNPCSEESWKDAKSSGRMGCMRKHTECSSPRPVTGRYPEHHQFLSTERSPFPVLALFDHLSNASRRASGLFRVQYPSVPDPVRSEYQHRALLV